MTMMRSLRQIRNDENGATMLEFAFVGPVFILMIIGAMDIGYSTYIRAVAAGALEATARSGSLDGATESQVQTQIQSAMYNILPKYARNPQNVVITVKNYSDFSRIDAAEIIVVDHDSDGVLDAPETTDLNGNGKIDSGDCWRDEDGNNQYGINTGLNGIGGADDSAYYNVIVKMDSFFPLYRFLNKTKEKQFTLSTLVINQPYQAQAARPVICRTS
jgi:Flp pilus assembly pilin Flp